MKKPNISVIVCAKNESENIQKHLPLLLDQNYPNYEIVLIDDASTDDTLDNFEDYERKHKNVKLVKVVNNETFWGNKKYALTLGIKASSYENLLFIDADTFPNSKNWITEMSSCFDDQKSIVLGYGGYTKEEGSFINKLIRFDTVLTALQYFSWAKIGKPYMGVGRNLAYKKATFFEMNGFINHIKIRSGDDDLFINEAGNKLNTTFIDTPDSFTYSYPKTNFKDWFVQKRRHVSTSEHYKKFDKIQLGTFFGLIVFRYLFAWIAFGYATSKFKEKDITIWFPILEIVLIFTQFQVFLANKISKPNHWK